MATDVGPCLRYSFVAQEPAEYSAMKTVLASMVTTILILAMTLAAMFTLVAATLRVTALEDPLQRALAFGAELVLGVVLLLGTVWLATHLAVRIFAPRKPDPGGPLG